MGIFEFNGKQLALDDDGNLKDPDDWSEELGRYLFERDGITLTDRHWEIILFMRSYYLQYRVNPMPRIIIRELNKKRQGEKYTVRYLYELFPTTPIQSLCKYAGIPQPAGCG